MSQVNIQQLLNLNPVAPNQVSQTPVDYKTSSFQGGGFKPGQMAQLPRSSEEVMFANLSQIAGGVAQSIQTFGNIASQIDKERIDKVEAEWERIDAEDKDPRDKTSEFDSILKSVSTPITGENWKQRIAARMSKSWGKEAFEKYVETQFNEQAQRWDGYDGKMGPIKTQEFLTQFNIDNPSLTGSNFITGLSYKTQAQLREFDDQVTSNNLIQIQENDYMFSPEQIAGLAQKTLDIEELRQTSPKVVKALELAASSTTEDDFIATFTKGFWDELDPAISELDEEVQRRITVTLDQYRSNLAKKLWDANTQIRRGNNFFKLQYGVSSSISTFRASPNNESFGTLSRQSLLLLPDLAPAAQKQYLDTLVGTVYAGLASNEWGGYEGFRDLPVQNQFTILEQKVRELLPGDVLASRLKKDTFGSTIDVTNQDEVYKNLIDFFKVSQTGLELKANISTAADGLVKSLGAQAELNEAFGRATDISALLTNFAAEFAKKTGIDEEIWKSVLFNKNKDNAGNVYYTITDKPPSQIFQDENIRKTLSSIGYGETELGGLFTIVSGLVKGQGKGKGGGGGGGGSIDVPKYVTGTSATAALLTKPGLIQAAQNVGEVDANSTLGQDVLAVRQAAQNLNIQTQTLAITSTYSFMQSQLNERDRIAFQKGQEAENKQNNGSATQEDVALAKWFKENYGPASSKFKEASTRLYGTTLDKVGFFQFENGVEVNPLSDENLRNRSNWVDQSGTITPQGHLLGLRLMVQSQAWAQTGMSNEAGFNDYIKSIKAQIETLANGDLRTADPALLYKTLYALKGLKAGRTEPVGLGSAMGETDQIYFHKLLEFLSTAEIPENPRRMDAKTKTFMNGFNIAIETMGLSQNLGVLFNFSGYSDNPKDAAATVIGALSSGDYTALLPKDTTSDGTNVTIRVGQFFGFPGLAEGTDDEKAQKVVDTIYEIASGLGATGRGPKGEILGLPSPIDSSDFQIEIPTKEGSEKVRWSEATPDQKMSFYFTKLRSLAMPNLIASMAYPAAVAQVLSRDETFGTQADRAMGLSVLMAAGNEYKRRRNTMGSVNMPTILWEGTSNFATRFDPYFSEWSILKDFKSSVPQVDTDNPNLQPQNLIHSILGLSFENSSVPSFNELEIQTQMQDPRNMFFNFFTEDISSEKQVEDLANEIYGTEPKARIGVTKGLDPVDQFVVGLFAMPARKQSMDYFFSSLGLNDVNGKPITSESLLSALGPELRQDLDKILTERTDTSIITVVERFFPHVMKPIQERILQFNLGAGQPNKVRFNASVDGANPVLEFSVKDQPYNVLGIKLGEVPKLPEVSFPTTMQKTEGSIRWVNAFRTIRDMQNKPELFQYQPEFSAPTIETKTPTVVEGQEQPPIDSSQLAEMPREVRERIIERQRREAELKQLAESYNPNAPRWKATVGPQEPTAETKLENMYAEAKMQRDLQKQKQEQAELEERQRIYWSKPENQERRRDSYLQYRLQQEAKTSIDSRYQKDLNEFNAQENQLLETARQQDAFRARQQVELEEWNKKQQQEFEENEKRIRERLREDTTKHPATVEARKQKLLEDEKANKEQAQRDFQERQQKELDKWNKEKEKTKEENEKRIRDELRLRMQKSQADKDLAEAANLVEYTKKRMELYPNNSLLRKDYEQALQNFAKLRVRTQGVRRGEQ